MIEKIKIADNDWLAQNKTYLPHIEEPVSQNPSSGIQRQKRDPEKAVCKGVFKLNLTRVSLMYIL
jgi:hypothetical protein